MAAIRLFPRHLSADPFCLSGSNRLTETNPHPNISGTREEHRGKAQQHHSRPAGPQLVPHVAHEGRSVAGEDASYISLLHLLAREAEGTILFPQQVRYKALQGVGAAPARGGAHIIVRDRQVRVRR